MKPKEIFDPTGSNFDPNFESGHYPKKPAKESLFLWTVFLLLLVIVGMLCWIGSYYIFGHPEDPLSYAFLKKVKKIQPPQRFSVNAAPDGEFITAEKFYGRCNAMNPVQFREMNQELVRAYLRNYQQKPSPSIPYITGRFHIIAAYRLKPRDLFPSGVVVLASCADEPRLLIEHLYTSSPNTAPLIKRNLQLGMDIDLRRTYDLSAVVHASRMADGRILLTVVPLNYGAYGLKGTRNGFNLDPPPSLNLAAGWPVLKAHRLEHATGKYLKWRRKNGLTEYFPLLKSVRDAAFSMAPNEKVTNGKLDKKTQTALEKKQLAKAGAQLASADKTIPIQAQVAAVTGIDKPPIPPEPQVVEERLPPLDRPNSKSALAANGKKKNKKNGRYDVAENDASKTLKALPVQDKHIASAPPQPVEPPKVEKALPLDSPNPGDPVVVKSVPPSSQSAGGVSLQPFQIAEGAPPVAAAIAVVEPNAVTTAEGNAASANHHATNSHGIKSVDASELATLEDQPSISEPIYLSGQFVVTAVGKRSVVLRPKTNETNANLQTRIIAEYPANKPLPAISTEIADFAHAPYQITDIRKGTDGTLNVYVREAKNSRHE